MSVILKGLSMPKSCSECKLSFDSYNNDTQVFCYSNHITESINDYTNRRHPKCPLQSIDDLISNVKKEYITEGQVYSGEFFSDDAENINYGVNKAIESIQKFCK